MNIQENGRRVIEYCQQYGFKYFLKHSVKKVLKYEERQYDAYRNHIALSEEELERQRKQQFPYMPVISIVVPLYKTPKKYLQDMIESVRSQSYSNWELCLSDGSGCNSELQNILQTYSAEDARIHVINNARQLDIASNTNKGLEEASGDYVAFMDHDDMLAPNALYECVKCVNRYREADIIYTDEDKVSADGTKYFQPHFKSDYNKDLLLSMNYICHLLVVNKKYMQQIGYIRAEYNGAQDYDFLLRCIEKSENIVHIPKILYHWRSHNESTAQGVGRKNYADDAGRRALQDYFDRNDINAKAEPTDYEGIYRAKYALTEKPKVTIIIPNKDHVEDLKKCLLSIKRKAGYDNYEILIVENNSGSESTFKFYRKLQEKTSNVRVVYWNDKFNYAAINNWGASQALGSYLLFLNNDVEWISENFLREMLSVALRDEVGIVGNLLYFPNDTVQHAGVVMGYDRIAGHAFIGTPRGIRGYFSRIICMQDYSAVTAACMMVSKETFQSVGGFDTEYEVAFNDVDFCLRVLHTGKLVVYDPYAQAYHYESKSRGSDATKEHSARFEREKKLLRKKWGDYIDRGDPYYNKNLTLMRPDFAVKEVGK